MELADVTDSKSVGSNTVRVRPPPSAPKKQGYAKTGIALLFWCRGGELALCGSCKDARWRSHKVGARTRRPQRPQFDTPLHFRPLNERGAIFWCGGRENPQLAGKARMPYKMNAQSFKQGCIKTATQSRCTMQRHKWLSMHRCSDPNDRKRKDA